MKQYAALANKVNKRKVNGKNAFILQVKTHDITTCKISTQQCTTTYSGTTTCKRASTILNTYINTCTDNVNMSLFLCPLVCLAETYNMNMSLFLCPLVCLAKTFH